MSRDYGRYHLSMNPFPQTATIDIYSSDPRINGSVFCKEVFDEEISELEGMLRRRTNLIYVLGYEWEKGTGKSALLVDAYKNFREIPNSLNLYLKCSRQAPLDNPDGFCIGVVKELHLQNILWRTLQALLTEYVSEAQPLFPKKAAIDTIFEAYPEPPIRLPLVAYTHVRDPQTLASAAADWLHKTEGLDKAICERWLRTYLSEPREWSSLLDKIPRRDAIKNYSFFTSLLMLTGIDHTLIFLDQFEDALMKVPDPKVGEFCLGMRNMLEASRGHATIVVSLHPEGDTKLTVSGGDYLTQLAPIDMNHMVSVMTLKEKQELVVPLALAYLERMRISQPPYLTHPFTPEALRMLCEAEGGNIRQLLQRLHHCVEYGLEKGIDEYTPQAVANDTRGILGRQIDIKANPQ